MASSVTITSGLSGPLAILPPHRVLSRDLIFPPPWYELWWGPWGRLVCVPTRPCVLRVSVHWVAMTIGWPAGTFPPPGNSAVPWVFPEFWQLVQFVIYCRPGDPPLPLNRHRPVKFRFPTSLELPIMFAGYPFADLKVHRHCRVSPPKLASSLRGLHAPNPAGFVGIHWNASAIWKADGEPFSPF